MIQCTDFWKPKLQSHIAWRHQAITWTNVDLSSKMFCGIHLKAISQEELMSLIHHITLLKLHCHIPRRQWIKEWITHVRSGGRFKNTYELLNLRALKFSPMNKICIFQCMGIIFCVAFQRYSLKFHTKYLTHTLKDVTFKQHWNFKSS